MTGAGKVVIVGTDPENAQRARGLFELFEDSSPLAEEEWLHMSQDFSSLSMWQSQWAFTFSDLNSRDLQMI